MASAVKKLPNFSKLAMKWPIWQRRAYGTAENTFGLKEQL